MQGKLEPNYWRASHTKTFPNKMTPTKTKTKYMCSVYKKRPITCIEYPWNKANQLFSECIFVDVENDRLRTYEEQLTVNTEEEISDYCVDCGRCCFYGPAQCSELNIITIEEPVSKEDKE